MCKKIVSLVFVLSVFLTACPHGQNIPKPDPKEPTDTEWCDAACTHLKALGCEEGEDFSDGETCTEFCIKTQVSGHALSPKCIVEKVKKCEDIAPLCEEQ